MTKTAWDPEHSGYGKHAYREIDPSTINPADYAVDMRGEQEHKGEIREYDISLNKKHPENNMNLEWLCRVGTSFELDGKQYQVTDVPVMRDNRITIRVTLSPTREQSEISAYDLGVVVGPDDMYKQVKCVLIQKGRVDKQTRIALTKRH